MSQFLFILVVIFSFSAFSADLKLGFVDVRKIVSTSKEGKKIQTDLKKKAKEYETEIKSLEKKIKEMQGNLIKKQAVLSQEKRNEQIALIEEKKARYLNLAQRSQVDLQKREQQRLQPLVEKIQKEVASLSKQGKYDFIFTAAQLGWADPRYDLTAKVLKAVNKK